MRTAVVGHVEWVQFARVSRLPDPGEIVHASDWWEEAGGGGAVVAVELARLGGEVTFLTALGDDDIGRRVRERLESFGVRVAAAERPEPQRRAFTYVDAAGERTITVMGERLVPYAEDPLPWEELGAADGVFFTGGDRGALIAARRARTLVATPRAGEVLLGGDVGLDVLVGSGRDPGERLPRALDPAPAVTVETMGPEDGRVRRANGVDTTFPAAPQPARIEDAYGAGDCFAAGLTHALARGDDLDAALGLAARCGAECLARRGPYGVP